MKKKIKDLQKGDEVQLFTNLIPVPHPYTVTLIEMQEDSKTISGLHLESPAGDKRMYSFLGKEQELTMWAGYDVGSSYTEGNICAHCGRVKE